MADPPSFIKTQRYGRPTPAVRAGFSGWSLEESLDVEWAHAVGAESQPHLDRGRRLVRFDGHGGDSSRRRRFAECVRGFHELGPGILQRHLRAYFTTPAGHIGITFLAQPATRCGRGIFPGILPDVVAVGGTSLYIDGSGTICSETGGAGPAAGKVTAKPSQATSWGAEQRLAGSSGCFLRCRPYTGVAILDSYDYGFVPLDEVGGTSLSTPCSPV